MEIRVSGNCVIRGLGEYIFDCVFSINFMFANRALKPRNSLIAPSNLSRWMYCRTTDYRLRFCEAALFISSGCFGQKEDHSPGSLARFLEFHLELKSRFRNLVKFIFTVWALTKTCYLYVACSNRKIGKINFKISSKVNWINWT